MCKQMVTQGGYLASTKKEHFGLCGRNNVTILDVECSGS